MKRNILATMALTACLSGPAMAQSGPLKSNLKKALIYFYNYAGDHTNTPDWCGYLIKLGAAHGIAIDTTRNQSNFTAANLANYQAVVLFNAYLVGQNMSQTQKDALRDWYGKNRGIACFHQCVKNSWGGASPNWYDSLMGGHYIKAAGFGTGPVTVEAGVTGTDLAMNSDSTPVAAGASQKWNDEWYTYDQTPVMPGTKLIWTTKAAEHSFTFVLPGEVQPMAWARVTNGGRFVLNSMYHTSDLMKTTDAALKKFNDGQFLGSMRWAAGYAGCTDAASKYYNPQATHNDPKVCSDGVFTGTVPIRIGVNVSAGKKAIAAGRLRITFAGEGAHTLAVFDSRGRKVYGLTGQGPREYGFESLRPGVYFLQARSGQETFHRSFMLL
jgi:hypothetical protein